MRNIIIVGGGAGGIILATDLGRRLGKKKIARVTLIDKQLTHIWKPLLHEIAAGSLNSYTDELNYFAHARKNHFEFLPGELQNIDRENKKITLAEYRDIKDHIVMPVVDIAYDILILAIGSVCNDFNTDGADQHCVFMDSRKQAEHFHQTLISHYVSAQRNAMPDQQLDICIVGAGATGVELAAELHQTAHTLNRYGLNAIKAQHVRVTLVEAASRVLPAMPERMALAAQRELEELGVRVLCGEKVTGINATTIHTASDRHILADIKVWSAGIKGPNFLQNIAGLETTPSNQLVVRKTLQSTRDDNIFAIGDCASLTLTTEAGELFRVPPRAQSAYQQAKILAKSLIGNIRNNDNLLDFTYKDHGSLVSLANENAIGNLSNALFGTINFEGIIARFMYLMLYRMHQAALHGWPTTLLIICRDILNRSTGPRLKLH